MLSAATNENYDQCQADIPVAQVSDVARFYFENNSTTQSGKNLSTQSLSMLGNYDLSYAANPTEHGQYNLATGNIVSSLWSVEGEGNTITFDSWVDADGNEVNGRAYSVSRSDSLPNGSIYRRSKSLSYKWTGEHVHARRLPG